MYLRPNLTYDLILRPLSNSLARCLCVSKLWKEVAESDELWKERIDLEWHRGAWGKEGINMQQLFRSKLVRIAAHWKTLTWQYNPHVQRIHAMQRQHCMHTGKQEEFVLKHMSSTRGSLRCVDTKQINNY